MITRRKLLISAVSSLILGSACAPLAASANTSNAVDVVKIMSFACPVCRASEAQDHLIERAATATGGRFIRGPVPSLLTETGEKEQVYYASRNISKEFSERLVDLFYKGQQDLSIPLDNITQVYVYLQQQLENMDDFQLNALFSAAQQPEAKTALTRAASLAYRMGVEDVPSYILVVAGQPAIVHAPNTIGSSSLSALREEVIKSIATLSKGT